MSEWTILVFLNGKNNLEPFAFPNFAQMASIGSTPEVNLVVEFGRPKRHFSLDYGGWSKTLRFHIQKGMKPVEASALQDLGATNMGDAQTLRDFVRWGREHYPAKRTMLVIWNHGQGWRVPQAAPFEGDLAAQSEYRALRSEVRGLAGAPPAEAPTLPDELRAAGGLRYVSNDDDTGDKLYNRAIQDTLKGLLGSEKLDVIAFDACLMAMVETAYALRDVCQVLVGSEELEPGSGWNYTRWLQPLVDAKGALSAVELGKAMVKGFELEYGDNEQTTLSATDLSRVPELASAISAFAEAALAELSPAHLGSFKKARAACANYAPGYGLHSIDLGHYMEQIGHSMLSVSLKQRAAAVRTALGHAVCARYASASRRGKFGSQGLAIYYPLNAFAHKADPDGQGYDPHNAHYPVEFVQKEKWALFLREYWRLLG